MADQEVNSNHRRHRPRRQQQQGQSNSNKCQPSYARRKRPSEESLSHSCDRSASSSPSIHGAIVDISPSCGYSILSNRSIATHSSGMQSQGSYSGGQGGGYHSDSGSHRQPNDTRQASQHSFLSHNTDGSTHHSSNNSSDLFALKRDREREGRCSECGAQTHEFRIDRATGATIKEPLTVEDEVHRGRCLLCHPLNFRGLTLNATTTAPTPNTISALYNNHSQRSVNTVSSYGGNSVHSDPISLLSGGAAQQQPIRVSSSTLPPNAFYSTQQQQQHTSSNRSGRSNNNLHNATTEETTSSTSTLHSSYSQQQSRAAFGVRNTSSSGNKPTLEEQAAQIEETLSRLESESTDLCDILSAMRRYPSSLSIQKAGCEKLWIQSWDDENSSAIGRVGGIPTVLEAMRTYISNQGLQQCGMEALRNLASVEYNRDIIEEWGGIQVIVTSMKDHIRDSNIQEVGCTALCNLAQGGDHKLSIAEYGGLHAILNAVQHWPEDEGVLRGAYQTLQVLGYNPMEAIANGSAGVNNLVRQAQQQQLLQQQQGHNNEMEEEDDFARAVPPALRHRGGHHAQQQQQQGHSKRR